MRPVLSSNLASLLALPQGDANHVCSNTKISSQQFHWRTELQHAATVLSAFLRISPSAALLNSCLEPELSQQICSPYTFACLCICFCKCVCVCFAWEGFPQNEKDLRNSTRPSWWDPENGNDFSEMRWNHGKTQKNGNCLSLQTWYLLEGICWLPWCSSYLFPESSNSVHNMQRPNYLRCVPETNLAKWKEGLALTSMNHAELRSGLNCSQTPTSPEELDTYDNLWQPITTYDILWHLMTREYAQGMLYCK